MKNVICFLVLSFCIINISQSQTRIVTKSGNKILGIVVSENASEVILNSIYDEQIVMPVNSIVSRDTLYFGIKTKSGIGFAGTITAFNKDGFDFLSQDGIKMTLKYDGIDNFYFDDSELRKVMESKMKNQKQNTNPVNNMVQNNNTYPVEKLADNYQKFGFAILMPAVGNFVYGYTTKKFAFHLSCGFWGASTFGIQVGPGINLSLSKNTENNLLFNFSYLSISKKTFQSINILWDANFSGFHIQAGLGFGSGSFTSPQLMGQIGYAYRWGK